MKEDHLVALIVRQLSGELDLEGSQELERWAEEDLAHRQLLEHLSNETVLGREINLWSHFDPAEGYAKWLSYLDDRLTFEDNVIPIRRRKRFITAAAVVLLVAAGGLLWQHRHSSVENKQDMVVATRVQDFKPGGNKAILTLSGGAKIILEEAKSGAIAEQGGSKIKKLADGQVAYADNTSKSVEVLYNTITTPPGGTYEVTLSDGTKVWLNAASSMRFPTAFKGASRRVEVNGEAYFEVVHDGSKPFFVSVNRMDVEVLGTHFDVNAYSDEPQVKATLIEGKVKVKKGNTALLLAPGDQANLQGEHLAIAHNVDVSEAVAWKNGFFQFNGADIQTVMRTLARWYNVNVVYEGQTPKVLASGSISRNNMASVVMQVLQAGGFHFRIKNNTIVVMP